MENVKKIATGKVSGRRVVRFASIDELMADARNLIDSERRGKLSRLGNWTLAQNLNHLGTWVKFSFDGAPMSTPWFVKVPLRLFLRKRFIQGPMPAGKDIPGVANGTFGAEPVELDEAINRFESEFARLKKSPPALAHMIFGPLTHDEWISTHLRHAELHLSFMQPA